MTRTLRAARPAFVPLESSASFASWEVVHEFPADFGSLNDCTYELVAVSPSESEQCRLDASSEICRLVFYALLEEGCTLYYFSSDNGCYWGQQGKYQKLFVAIFDTYIPPYGYPRVEMYAVDLAKAISMVYALMRIQHEWYNNGFMNVDICDVRESIDDNLTVLFPTRGAVVERLVGYDYFRMVKYMADSFELPHAIDLVTAYQEAILDLDETHSNPPSDIEWDSEEEYDAGNDSEYDDEMDKAANETSYRARKRSALDEFHDRTDKERIHIGDTLKMALEEHIPLLGRDVMEKVRSTLTKEEILELENGMPDPSTQAAFNRLGVCCRPGLCDGESYAFGEFKRASVVEMEREAKRQKREQLFDESLEAKKRSDAATRQLQALSEKERLLQEEHQKGLQHIEAERKELEAQIDTFDAQAASKQNELLDV